MTEIELIAQDRLRRESANRLDRWRHKTVALSELDSTLASGWTLEKRLVRSAKVRQLKDDAELFRDQVWAMVARLGMTQITAERNEISLDHDGVEIVRVSLVAADDEVALPIRVLWGDAKSGGDIVDAFISQYCSRKPAALRRVRSLFPHRTLRFVLAVGGFSPSPRQLERLEQEGVALMSGDEVQYYLDLAALLGPAAKYQLLGNVLAGSKIETMRTEVPAIKSRMGGHDYFAFTIDPERLLKIAYILHRNAANSRTMPSYQRLIKRERLRKVTQFVEGGNMFPNSLVINIESGRKGPRFDRIATAPNSESSVGILHLPRRYRSAYVIDGQHRLYGFSGSRRSSTEVIPVVAFVDLEPQEQVKLFMQINENQQPVPKNLRNTLNADLLWFSDDQRERAKSLRLKIAQELGEGEASPLRGRVIIGEETATDLRCLSMETLERAINQSRFVGVFSSRGIKERGSLYLGLDYTTVAFVYEFLELAFDWLSSRLNTQWNLGRGDGGYIFTNAGTDALIRVMGDVVDFITLRDSLDPNVDRPERYWALTLPLMEVLCESLETLSAEDAANLRGRYGSGGSTTYWRTYQSMIAASVDGFLPPGLRAWEETKAKRFNSQVFDLLRDIEAFLKRHIRTLLESHYGHDGKQGVPQAVYTNAATLAAEKEYESGGAVDWWDCLHLSDYHRIMRHGTQEVWLALFDSSLAITPDGEKKASSWRERSSWMNRVVRIRNAMSHDGSASEADFRYVQNVHRQLGLNPESSHDMGE